MFDKPEGPGGNPERMKKVLEVIFPLNSPAVFKSHPLTCTNANPFSMTISVLGLVLCCHSSWTHWGNRRSCTPGRLPWIQGGKLHHWNNIPN